MPYLLLTLCLFWATPALAADLELDLACLNEAYPAFITGTETDAEGRTWLLTRNGARLLYDDGKAKSHAEMLEHADIEDSMSQIYPLEPARPDLAPDEEAGRIRCYPLLNALYGDKPRSVEHHVVKIPFDAKRSVRLITPAAEAFGRVAQEWHSQATDPALDSYFNEMGGYYWRKIAGTNRLSAHSFGIAIDLNPSKGPYWRWSKLRRHPQQKTYPHAIVALFEKNGFVWGGKWEHFDLMHFEFRPELIIKARKLRERQVPQS